MALGRPAGAPLHTYAVVLVLVPALLALGGAAEVEQQPSDLEAGGGSTGLASGSWLPSSHTCFGSEVPEEGPPRLQPPPASCVFRNVYIWDKRVYYLTSDGEKGPDLDSFDITFDTLLPKGMKPDAKLIMSTASISSFQAMVAKRGVAGVSDAAEEIDTAYFWKGRRVVPTIDPSDSEAKCDGISSVPGKVNYYHFIAEHFPVLAMTLCERFGHCNYADRSSLQIIDVEKEACHVHENYPKTYLEALSCLSDKPLRNLRGKSFEGKLVVVRQAWMGRGPRCRGISQQCKKKNDRFLPITPAVMWPYRRLMEQCFSLPPAPRHQAPLNPVKVLVIDRLYENGRHILNINSIMKALLQRYPPDKVHISLQYMEGLTLQQQADVISSASIIIHMHGSTMANYFFLSKNSVAVEIGPGVSFFDGPSPYTRMIKTDLRNVTDIASIGWRNKDKAAMHVNTEALRENVRRWSHGSKGNQEHAAEIVKFMADGTLYSQFLNTFECAKNLDKKMERACFSLQYRVCASVPLEVMLNLTDTAIRLAFEKQGVPAPAWLPSTVEKLTLQQQQQQQQQGGFPPGAMQLQFMGLVRGVACVSSSSTQSTLLSGAMACLALAVFIVAWVQRNRGALPATNAAGAGKPRSRLNTPRPLITPRPIITPRPTPHLPPGILDNIEGSKVANESQ